MVIPLDQPVVVFSETVSSFKEHMFHQVPLLGDFDLAGIEWNCAPTPATCTPDTFLISIPEMIQLQSN
ncbi:hypothetical protein J6590_086849 [Homalodisca vitripennis]|nr:hypothetical protein J6590_086849 [Homalodisca vitripennis]